MILIAQYMKTEDREKWKREKKYTTVEQLGKERKKAISMRPS